MIHRQNTQNERLLKGEHTVLVRTYFMQNVPSKMLLRVDTWNRTWRDTWR